MHEFKLCAKDCSQTDTLAETLNIYCTDVSIDFGISNSSVLTMKWGNIVARTGIGLPTGETVTDLEEMDTNTLIFWSWMTSLETDKLLITETYTKMLQLLMKLKLNAGNPITAVKRWAVSVVKYSRGVFDWTTEKLQILGREKWIQRMQNLSWDDERFVRILRSHGIRWLMDYFYLNFRYTNKTARIQARHSNFEASIPITHPDSKTTHGRMLSKRAGMRPLYVFFYNRCHYVWASRVIKQIRKRNRLFVDIIYEGALGFSAPKPVMLWNAVKV